MNIKDQKCIPTLESLNSEGKKNFSFVCLFGLRTLININKRQVSMSIKRRFSRNFYNKELLKVIPCEVVKGKSY